MNVKHFLEDQIIEIKKQRDEFESIKKQDEFNLKEVIYYIFHAIFI